MIPYPILFSLFFFFVSFSRLHFTLALISRASRLNYFSRSTVYSRIISLSHIDKNRVNCNFLLLCSYLDFSIRLNRLYAESPRWSFCYCQRINSFETRRASEPAGNKKECPIHMTELPMMHIKITYTIRGQIVVKKCRWHQHFRTCNLGTVSKKL